LSVYIDVEKNAYGTPVGVLYVGYIGAEHHKASVYKLDGSWVSVGNRNFTQNEVDAIGMYAYNGTCYLAYRENVSHNLGVMKSTALGNWVPVKFPTTLTPRSPEAQLGLTGYNDTLYLAYPGNSNKIQVMRYE
jgi:hypothetical protein